MKKLIALLVSLSLMLSLAVCAFAEGSDENAVCAELTENAEEPLNFLLLGDSIAYGAGLVNHDEACYGKMVCNTNGYNYKNDAIKGYDTSNLLDALSKKSIQQDIKNADIIDISIGANDIIRASNYMWMIMCAAVGNYNPLQNSINSFTYPNFCKIIDTIKELNPDAKILVQTIYNPRPVILRGAFEKGIKLMNNCYYKYLEENPDAYTIVDVHGALQNAGWYTAIDTIHPNGHGNKVIAKAVLKTLKEMKLGEKTEPVILTEPVDSYLYPIFWVLKIFR